MNGNFYSGMNPALYGKMFPLFAHIMLNVEQYKNELLSQEVLGDGMNTTKTGPIFSYQ